MSWNELASNQMVNQDNAVTSPFSLNEGQSHGSGTLCFTKVMALAKYNLNPTPMNGYASNQLVPKQTWVAGTPPVTSYAYLFSINSGLTPLEACGFTNLSLNLYAAEQNLPSVSILYSDSNLTNAFNGENKYRKHAYGINATSCQIGTDGTLLSFENLC